MPYLGNLVINGVASQMGPCSTTNSFRMPQVRHLRGHAQTEGGGDAGDAGPLRRPGAGLAAAPP